MTAQVHERLIYEGERTSMACCPPLPDGNPRLFEPASGELALGEKYRIVSSTACWRGYIGTWEIRDNRFYLVDVRGRYQLREGPPIFADWFSGELRVPKGQMLEYMHLGFGSVYEQDLLIAIRDGVVVETRTVSNTGYSYD